MKKYLAEFLGTLILIFMGCGSAVVLGCDVSGGHLAVAFTFGLGIVAIAYTIGGISGCHINPAVSFAMMLSKRMSSTDFIGYVVAQLAGGIAGAGLLKALLGFGIQDATGAFATNGVANAGGTAGAIIIEAILTFIFISTILAVTSDEKKESVAGIVIGLSLTFVNLVGIPLTGTSVNPARSIGPALFQGGAALSEVWVFIVAPLIGAALAAVVFVALQKNDKE